MWRPSRWLLPAVRRQIQAPAALILIVLLALAAAAPRAQGPSYAGRPLADALEDLRRRGLELIYSTAVVTPEMVVQAEPRSRRLRDQLHEILQPLGLEARPGPGSVILIVRRGGPPAATARLTGRVLSAELGRPVVRATIRVAEAGVESVTRPDGTFTLGPLPAGTYTVTVSAPWFLEQRLAQVDIGGEAPSSLEVSLQARPGYVEEVIVTPGRLSLVQQDQAGGLALGREDALLVPSIGGDVSRVLETLPGVAGPDNSAAFNIRGSTSEDVSFVLDGLELYDPFHLQAFQSPFSLIDSEIVERIDILRGGFAADAGDRHGGFVRVSSRVPEMAPRTHLEAGTLKSRFSHAAPLASGSLLVSGRAWYPEAVWNTIELQEQGIDPRFQDAYLNYSAHVSPRTLLSAHALLGHDRLRYAESGGGERVRSDNQSSYLWLRGLQSFAPGVLGETVLSAGRLDRSREGISEPEDDPLLVDDDRRVEFYGLKHDLSWELSGSHLLRTGLEVRSLDASYRYTLGPPGATSTLSLDPTGTSFALYVSHRAALTERLATEVGLRWDRQQHTDDNQLSPRLNALWRAGPRSEVRLGLGDFHQSQRIHELRVEDSETAFLPAERSRQVDVTFQRRLGTGMVLRLDAYHRWLTRIHPRYENQFNPLELFPETEADRVVIAPERARLRGVEILLRGAPEGRLAWWASYALSAADDIIGGQDVPRNWDQRHAALFLVAYRWEPGWSVAVSGSVRSGWPTTPVTGEEVTLPDGSTEIQPVAGPRNSDRFAPYGRLDLKVARTFPLRRGRLLLALQIANLTDRTNECCVDEFLFSTRPDGSVATERLVNPWIGITPSFSLVWEF